MIYSNHLIIIIRAASFAKAMHTLNIYNIITSIYSINIFSQISILYMLCKNLSSNRSSATCN